MTTKSGRIPGSTSTKLFGAILHLFFELTHPHPHVAAFLVEQGELFVERFFAAVEIGILPPNRGRWCK